MKKNEKKDLKKIIKLLYQFQSMSRKQQNSLILILESKLKKKEEEQ